MGTFAEHVRDPDVIQAMLKGLTPMPAWMARVLFIKGKG